MEGIFKIPIPKEDSNKNHFTKMDMIFLKSFYFKMYNDLKNKN